MTQAPGKPSITCQGLELHVSSIHYSKGLESNHKKVVVLKYELFLNIFKALIDLMMCSGLLIRGYLFCAGHPVRDCATIAL
jgi:hypothetical protein